MLQNEYDAIYERYNWDKFIFNKTIAQGTRECMCCIEKNIKKGDVYCSVSVFTHWSKTYPRPWGSPWNRNLCLKCAKELMIRVVNSEFDKLKELEELITLEEKRKAQLLGVK